jgi:hypothetical protein
VDIPLSLVFIGLEQKIRNPNIIEKKTIISHINSGVDCGVKFHPKYFVSIILKINPPIIKKNPILYVFIVFGFNWFDNTKIIKVLNIPNILTFIF